MEYAFYDFDGTLRRGNSIVDYVRYAVQKGKLNGKERRMLVRGVIRFALGLIDEAQIKTIALRFRLRMKADEKESFDRGFASKLVETLYPDALRDMAEQKAQGRAIVLVSASTDNYMRYTAEKMGCDRLICTRLTPDGVILENCKGTVKAQRIKREFAGLTDFSGCRAYGDSPSDLPMLRLTGHPVIVNGNRKLRKALPGADARRWKTK